MKSLPESLANAWSEAAANPGKPVSVGSTVVCDMCDADLTESTANGGFIFSSKAVCPECAPELATQIAKYNEESYIKARCPEGKSFADFVRDYRGENNSITVRTSVPKCCVECKQPFSDKNVHTEAGRGETAISGICEDCFDAIFQEEE